MHQLSKMQLLSCQLTPKSGYVENIRLCQDIFWAGLMLEHYNN